MTQSLFEWSSFKLGCNSQYKKSWSWRCFRCWDPNELHELHNDYLLAPDKIEIKRNGALL